MIDRKLLVRPSKHPFERVDDYLARLSRVNGFYSVTGLVEHLREWAVSRSLKLKGINKADTQAQLLSSYLGRTVEAMSFDEVVFAKKNTKLQVCKSCLAEHKAIMFYWYLDDYSWCHLHNEQLTVVASDDSSIEISGDSKNHPITDFMDVDDPWFFYSEVQKSAKELRWLSRDLKKFFEAQLSAKLETKAAQRWIDENSLAAYSFSEKIDQVTALIAEESGQAVNDIRLLSALLLWQRMLPDHLFRVAGSYAEEATEASLDWAARQLVASESMMRFIYDAHHAPRHSQSLRLRDYIPPLADISDATDKSFRKAFFSCGLIVELLGMVNSKMANRGTLEPALSLEGLCSEHVRCSHES
ncbi:MAG: hypothetical protein CL693_00375 [Cellvibrionaceae bacterium]|nr:hypothetical protein [Cellvibrionaceae bacterium]